MLITVNDIKRAISGGGDVSSFTGIYRQALGGSPVPILPGLDSPFELPEALLLIRNTVPDLVEATYRKFETYPDNRKVNGRDHPEGFTGDEASSSRPAQGQNSAADLPWGNIDLTLVSLPPYGKNTRRGVEQAVDTIHPDVIAVDSSPVELAADILYAFSLPCAAGLPFNANILRRDSGDVYTAKKFYPGNLFETVILKSWLRKVPVLSIGQPPKPVELVFIPNQGYADPNYSETIKWESSLGKAYRALDKEFTDVTGLQECQEIARAVNRSLLDPQSEEKRETIGVEASYIISRLMDITERLKTPGRKIRLLAFIDVAHLADIEYYIGLLRRGRGKDIYTPEKIDIELTDVNMAANTSDNLSGTVQEYTPASTLAQELFSREFADFVRVRGTESIPLTEAHKYIAEIAGRTRSHPQITRGISVRGTIAFAEILNGLAEMNGGLTRECIGKAALITLPPRILLKQKGNEVELVRDIALEVLYHFSLSSGDGEKEFKALKGISAEDILEKLGDLEQLQAEQRAETGRGKLPAVISEAERNREALKYLEKMEYVRKDAQNEYTLTRKALEFLLRDLENKLQAGEITPDEYSRQKATLMQKMKNITEPQFQMSNGEVANTIMEMIDAQDRQWNSEINFDTMHVYYHIKENSEGAELSPQKRDYYALRRLIDDLEKRKVLMAATRSSGFLLTGLALDILLKYLIDKDAARHSQGITGTGGAWTSERSHEIRRYSSGDAFRDISLRHTLRQIARQKKSLKDVRSNDFRVFMKQPRKPQSDIILCLDTSGSMGFHQKLMFARLAAAGLVQAGLQNGDRVGVVAFNDHGQVTLPLTATDKAPLLNCIASLSARGNTNIGDGIRSSSELLFRNGSQNQKHIILISDGQPTAVSESAFLKLKEMKQRDLTEESALLETRQAAARGIQLSVIHIAARGEPSDSFIKNIARSGKGKIRRVSGPEDLRDMLRG